MSPKQNHELARQVREQCIQTALSAYENASISGLCAEGAFEAAVSAMRMIDVDALAEEAADADENPVRRSGEVEQ